MHLILRRWISPPAVPLRPWGSRNVIPWSMTKSVYIQPDLYELYWARCLRSPPPPPGPALLSVCRPRRRDTPSVRSHTHGTHTHTHTLTRHTHSMMHKSFWSVSDSAAAIVWHLNVPLPPTPIPPNKNSVSVSWQNELPRLTYGVISYGSGWRKDVNPVVLGIWLAATDCCAACRRLPGWSTRVSQASSITSEPFQNQGLN